MKCIAKLPSYYIALNDHLVKVLLYCFHPSVLCTCLTTPKQCLIKAADTEYRRPCCGHLSLACCQSCQVPRSMCLKNVPSHFHTTFLLSQYALATIDLFTYLPSCQKKYSHFRNLGLSVPSA